MSPVMSPPDTLNIVRFALHPRQVFSFAYETGLSRRSWGAGDRSDLGYIVHGLFAAQFGTFAPKPFHIETPIQQASRTRYSEKWDQVMTVLGYCTGEWDELRAYAQQITGPSQGVIDWNRSAMKRMPTLIAGRRLAFSVRVCPVVRTPVRTEESRQREIEIDAYISACKYHESLGATLETMPSRAVIYQNWVLAKMLEAGVVVERIALDGFRLQPLARRGSDRSFRTLTRPVAECSGILEVQQPELFRTKLAHGIGRHRAFGLGMLRLAPVPQI